MGNAIARRGDAIANSTAYDHIEVSEYDYDPDGPDWDYGEVNATVYGSINSSNTTVFANGIPVSRNGDSTTESDSYSLGGWDYYEGGAHTNITTGRITGGSSTVFIGGVAVARKGDNINTHANTSSSITGGSANVFVG